MDEHYLKISQVRVWLREQFGIDVPIVTLRAWAKQFGWGVRLHPKGHYYIPASRRKQIAAQLANSAREVV